MSLFNKMKKVIGKTPITSLPDGLLEALEGDEAKHHQYLSWAIEKKEGWSKAGEQYIPTKLLEYRHVKRYLGDRFYIEHKNGGKSWSNNFQLEPPKE